MLNLSHVQAFIAIIDEGGFLQAAERLACSQPAVSQQLRKLEEALGVQLVVRTRGRPVPTADGALFLPKARALIAAAENIGRQFSQRRLVVAASGNIGVYLAPWLVAGFEGRDEMAARVDLRLGTNREAIDSLLAAEADVALTEWADDTVQVDWSCWRRERLVVIVPPGHPLAGRSHVAKTRLFDYPMIGGEPGTGTGRILRNLFGAELHRLAITRELGSTAAVKEAVKAGLGISIVLAYTVRRDVERGDLVALGVEEADVFKNLYAGIAPDLPESAVARRFAEYAAVAALPPI